MRITKKLVLGLWVIALFAVTATPAMAISPRWEECRAKEGGSFENSICTKEKEKGGFEWTEVPETLEVTSNSTGLRLEDSKATGGATAIMCEASGQGTVKREGQDSVNSIKMSHCEFVKAGSCETSAEPRANAVNLPWSTRLEEREDTETKAIALRDLLRSLTTKPPGWNIECRVAGIFTVTDTCEGGTSTNVESENTAGTIVEAFDSVSKQESANCSVGGSGAGFTFGMLTIKAKSEKGLRVEGPEIRATRKKGNGKLRKECRFTTPNERCVIVVEMESPKTEPTVKIIKSTIKFFAGPKQAYAVFNGTGKVEGERECSLGLKLKRNEESCALEVEYNGPVEPEKGEYLSVYEIQAEEEGGTNKKTPISDIGLATEE
jgi:hypothetical protein